ncbi:ralf-like 34, RAPID ALKALINIZATION FACTOR 34 [Hibiscus trionum]|uniref:Ralf-like 34, RAPID ALKALINIZATION FACTOR 34 n=1 Tax=Hibiscus trionum TaxID=183268 RepID=A0A9W7JBJ9_HIBTR|nr:ralf-like 34, RAPID ALKALINIZATION FACTOR 34 [Hibiscus trionum]
MPSSSSSSLLTKLLFPLLITHIVLSTSKLHAQVEETSLKLAGDALEWQLPMSFYTDLDDEEEADAEIDDGEGENVYGRRSLFWKRMRYYISYGALSANRIPCPPRSGRSYYTHNCFNAHGPVHPYSRGCSRITRCRR